LGLGNYKNSYSPTLLTLPNNEKISFLSCGGYHTICVTKNENIYVWGYNNNGQLGIGDTNNRNSPTLLNLPNNEKISFLSCSYNFTFCITKNENCYVWGRNDTGHMGFGDTNNRNSPTLLNLPNNEKISFLSCGYNFTICITKNENCYVWGYNK